MEKDEKPIPATRTVDTPAAAPQGGAPAASWVELSYPLKFPLEHEGATIKELVFREPDFETIETLEEIGFQEGVNPTLKQTRLAMAAVCRLPADVLKRMHRDDVRGAIEKMTPLLEAAAQE